MAEAQAWDFDTWLRDKLIELSTDDEVFSPYIKGILEGEENNEEKLEALQGILAEITENGIEDLCQDILQKWSLKENTNDKPDTAAQVDVDLKLAKIMEEQAASVVTAPKHSQEHRKLKSAILAQYAEISDGECTESDDEGPIAGAVAPRNTNAEDVVRAEREKRDKDKEESQKKKEKDKEDRTKQKTKDEERKEKEKKRTQKGERRR